MNNRNIFVKQTRYSNFKIASALTLGGSDLFLALANKIPTKSTQTIHYTQDVNTQDGGAGYNSGTIQGGTGSSHPSSSPTNWNKIFLYGGIGAGVIVLFLVFYKISK